MYNTAIIGCGNIAGGWNENFNTQDILTHAKAFEKHEKTNLIACVDTDLEKAKNFAARWNIPRFYDDSITLLKNEDIDILSVCTNTEAHRDIVKTSLEISEDIKAIMLEKPISIDIQQGIEIVEICKRTQTILNVNYLRRFDENHTNIRNLIANGDIGEIQCMNAYYTKGIRNNGIHLINLLQYLFGEVASETVLDSKYEFENDPTPSLFIKMTNGIPCYIHGLWEKYYSIFELDILGTRARISVKDSGNAIFIYQTVADEIYCGYTVLEADIKPVKSTLGYAMHNYLDNTIKAIEKIEAPKCTGEMGLSDLVTINRIINKTLAL